MNTFFLVDTGLMAFLQSDSFVEALKSLALAIVVWIVGSILIKRAIKFIAKTMEKSKMDESLRPFLLSLFSVLLKVLLILAVASTLGMEVTSFVAILSAAAFAVGMALQGGLSNFAGGIIILVFKPFRVNDIVTAQGFTGVVKEIQIFHTVLSNGDNEAVIIPNGPMANNAITNHTKNEKRGCMLTFGIAYDADIDLAKKIIMDVATSCAMVLDLEKSVVNVSSLGASSVNLTVRLWSAPLDTKALGFYMNEQVKKEFNKNNIGIPYQTLDVNIVQS